MPNATEGWNWGTPVFEEDRILFSYRATKNHLTFFPTQQSLEPFREELVSKTCGKDSVHVSYDHQLPIDPIRAISEHRAHDVRENDARWMY